MYNIGYTTELKSLIIEKNKLIQFQATILKLYRIPICIMDINQEFILEPVYLSEGCSGIEKNPLEVKRCKEEFSKLIENVRRSKSPAYSLCFTGYCMFAIPIMTNEKLLGALMGCQFRSLENTSQPEDSSAVISRGQLKNRIDILIEPVNIIINDLLNLINLTGELVSNYTEISLLYEIGDIFSEGLDVETASKIVLERLLELIEAERISLMLIDKETGELRIVFSRGLPEEIIKNTRVKIGEGISGFVAKEGKALLIENIEDRPEIKDLLIGKGGVEDNSFLNLPLICSPLKIENRVLGVLNVTNKKSGKTFSRYDLNLISVIGTQLAAIIENRRLFNDIKELFISTIKAFSLSLDAKDHYTYGHSQRVTECALAISVELNLSKEERATLELAGFLHDIGKIGIDKKILSKPAKLTEEEWVEIKKHPERGVGILKHIKQLSNVIPVILYHHEHFDGSGYPQGLKKDEIPILARILSVADAFDAMTSKRAYREAFSREEAVQEIKRCEGSCFDPLVTEAFLRALQKGVIK